MSTRTFSLTLVRHGQTTHNKLKIIQGQMETHLTDLGREQAELLGDYFEETKKKFDKVYSSDLIRAVDTCKLVCKDKYDIIKDKRLRERSFGVLQGSPLSELRAMAYKAGMNDNNFTQFRPEGGESVEEVQDRVDNFCMQELYIHARDSMSILIVTHGGVIRELMRVFKTFGCSISNEDLVISPNTGLSKFEIKISGENHVEHVVANYIHSIPHLTSKAREEALSEEQLNDASTKKEVEYGV